MNARVRSTLGLTLVCLGVATSGCATYVDRLSRASQLTASGNYAAAVADVNALMGVDSSEALPSQWSGDQPLAALERGSLQQALGEYTDSARDLSAAEQELELLDLKTDPIGTLGSYIYSDSVKTYRTPPTERLSLNAINLMNYLAEGNLDGAAVEARRFQVMRDYLATIEVDTPGPARLGTYLSGFVFDRRGEGDRALRYYEEALGGGPLASLDAPIARLASTNPYRGPKITAVLARQPRKPPESAAPSELLVVLALARVPHKEAVRIPVGAAVGIAGTWASGNVDWLKYGAGKVVVYPDLVATPSSLGSASVRLDGGDVSIEELTDLGASIRAEYEEAKPKIVAAALTRMATRAGVAEGVRAGGKQQSDALGDVLSILVEGTMVALDRPDTRSWTMLPDRVLVARLPVTPGQHTVDVSFSDGTTRTISADVVQGGFAAVIATEPR